jgi:hypothetical protein
MFPQLRAFVSIHLCTRRRLHKDTLLEPRRRGGLGGTARASSNGQTKFPRSCVTNVGALQTMLAWDGDGCPPTQHSCSIIGRIDRSESERVAISASRAPAMAAGGYESSSNFWSSTHPIEFQMYSASQGGSFP